MIDGLTKGAQPPQIDRRPFREAPFRPGSAPIDSGGIHILHPAGRRSWLRARLIALDVTVVAVAWAMALRASPLAGGRGLAFAGVMGAAGAGGTLAAIAAQHLYRSRVCSIRSLEIQALGRAALIGGGAAFASAELSGVTPRPLAAIAGAVAAGFVGLVVGRGGYRAWLENRRRQGSYTRDVVLIGANEEAAELHRKTRDHPEMGYRVIGFVGPPAASDALDAPWLGDYDQAVDATRHVGASGALLVATAMLPGHLNGIVRGLLDAGVHVQVSSGLRGIAARRLTTLPLAYEPLLYVERPHLVRTRLALKRGLDIALASVLLFATAPVLLLAALAIKLEDGGRVFFPQRRLGRHERPFTLYKLRTMVPDAEERLADLQGVNQRTNGPLFKASPDPRVTRVGVLLRASGIDELPQLINVITGTMSLIGPRPALAEEVAWFDDELRERASVRPGITGLWQVEAGDLPEFALYRRLDLYYVENLSLGLDLSILFATVWLVTLRSLRAIPATLRRRAVGETIVLD